jgi:GT2 family glycosyltransferase
MDQVDRVDVSVLIPTIGRSELLEKCLRSLEACRPRASEIVVIDQSRTAEIPDLVASFEHVGARCVQMHERGVALARNTGLEEAHHEIVALTDDDCIVAPDWVGAAHDLSSADPGAIFTGRVLPGEGGGHVPSTRIEEEPEDFTGKPDPGAFFSNNAIVPRSQALALGGFDARFPAAAAEDNDFGYRWLVDGRTMRFDPRLVVWHCDWRTDKQLRKLYWNYGRWQGAFYSKHLVEGDRRVLRFMRTDVQFMLRTLWLRARRRPTLPLKAAVLPVLGLPVGLWQGVRHFRKST